MNKFPDILKPQNVPKFKDYMYDLEIAQLRKDIHDFILYERVNTFFNFDGIISKGDEKNRIIAMVITELNKLGWKTKLVFGGTGMYIYTDKETWINDIIDS